MSEENSMGFDLPNENSVNLFDFDVEGYFSSDFEDSFLPNLGVSLLRMPMHIPSTLLQDVLMALERNEVEKCQLISILFRVFIDNSARLLPMRTGSFIRFSYNEILFHFEWLADSGALDHQDRGINKEFDVSTEDMNEIIAGKNVEKVILSKIQSGQIISQDMLLSSLLHSLNFIVFDYGDFDYYSYDYDTIEDCSEFIHLLCQLEDYIGGKIRIRRMEVNNLQKSILPTFKYLDFEPLTLKFEYCDGYDMHPDFEGLNHFLSDSDSWKIPIPPKEVKLEMHFNEFDITQDNFYNENIFSNVNKEAFFQFISGIQVNKPKRFIVECTTHLREERLVEIPLFMEEIISISKRGCVEQTLKEIHLSVTISNAAKSTEKFPFFYLPLGERRVFKKTMEENGTEISFLKLNDDWILEIVMNQKSSVFYEETDSEYIMDFCISWKKI